MDEEEGVDQGYVRDMDKVLKLFDAFNGLHWSDLSHALNRLYKLLDQNKDIPKIPRKYKISKRLSQSLHPATTTTCHISSIRIYGLIFDIIGPNGLADDLFLYLLGLLPSMEFVSLECKKKVIDIYETKLEPLGVRLRPCLKGLITSICLGQDPAVKKQLYSLMDKISESTGRPYFFSALWENVLTNPNVRQHAIVYVLEKLKEDNVDKKLAVSDLLGVDSIVAVRAVCQALQDSDSMDGKQCTDGQRKILEVLKKLFPTHRRENGLNEDHLVEILTAVLSVIRLNLLEKRFYDWILNDDSDQHNDEEDEEEEDESQDVNCHQGEDNASATCYFEQHSEQIFVRALRNLLTKSLDRSPDSGPYKVISKLLDRKQIKKVIYKDIIIDIFRALYKGYQKLAIVEKAKSAKSSPTKIKEKGVLDLTMQANVLLDDLKTGFVWDFCGKQFERTASLHLRFNQDDSNPVNDIGSQETSVTEICEILHFLLRVFPSHDAKFLPELFTQIIGVLDKYCSKFNADELERSLSLAQKILTKINPLSCENKWSDCVSAYRNFLVQFFRTRVFAECVDPKIILTKMIFNLTEDHASFLSRFFEDNYEPKPLNEMEAMTLVDDLCREYVPLRPDILRMSKSFQLVCQILVNLFEPKENTQNEEIYSIDESTDRPDSPTFDWKLLNSPLWFQYLLVSSSMFSPVQADIFLESVATLIHIMDKSVDSALSKQDMTIINHGFFANLGQKTVLPLIITSKLWNGLESMTTQHHQRCVELLYNLLNSLPVSEARVCSQEKQTCLSIEKVITRSLTSRVTLDEGCVIGAFQRFNLFWHLSRDVITRLVQKSDAKSLDFPESNHSRNTDTKPATKTFDGCLRLMLDNLNKSSGPLKTLTETWLVHSVSREDLARILEPLLLTLLAPETARVSVLHCKINLCATVEPNNNNSNHHHHLDGEEKSSLRSHRVYSITAANDQSIYHVSDGVELAKNWTDNTNFSVKTDCSEENIASSTNLAKRKFALNTFNQSLKKKSAYRKTDPYGGENFNFFNMPLAVNPFPFLSPEVEDFESYTSGYRSQTPSALVKSSSTSTLTSSSDDTTSISSSSIVSPASSLNKLNFDENGSVKLKPPQTSYIVKTILDEIITAAIIRADLNGRTSFDADEPGNGSVNLSFVRNPLVQPLHSHILLYLTVSDSRQILFAMQCIKNILKTNSRQTMAKLTSCNLNAANTPRRLQLQTLLARHRKSVFGQSFLGSLTPENMTTYRSSTLIEVLMSTLLYYLRSYYPNLAHQSEVREEIRGNREVQLMSIDIIVVIVSELALMVRDSGRAFATFIYDLFTRCKVHKVVLHTLLACVNDASDSQRSQNGSGPTLTDDILSFNEVNADGNKSGNLSEKISSYSEAFQIQILRLLLSLVMLEQIVSQQKGEGRDKSAVDGARPAAEQSSMIIRFAGDRVIPEQPMFLASIISALRQDKMRHLHSHWTSLVASCLPFLGRSLTKTVQETVSQLCANLERLGIIFTSDDTDKILELGPIPIDYVNTQLDALTVIYHYCLLDSSSPQVNMGFSHNSSGGGMSGSTPSASSEILTNLRHVFLSSFDPKNLVTNSLADTGDALSNARKTLICKLPRMIRCCVTLWMSVDKSCERKHVATCELVGNKTAVQNQLLSFLSPIALHHPVSFLSAVGFAWAEFRSSSISVTRQVLPTCNEDQLAIVDIVSAIRSMAVATLIQTVRQVLKSPPTIQGSVTSNAEVAVLQFFYFYLEKCSPMQVFRSWSNLASLLKDCQVLAPPAIFLAMAILSQFVQRSQKLADEKPDTNEQLQQLSQQQLSQQNENNGKLEKKDQKELQDLAEKLIQSCSKIAGSYLEQTTWLRRNFVVNSDLQEDANGGLLDDDRQFSEESFDGKKSLHHYAVPALSLLAELLAPVLDIIFQSDEKEKVVPILNSVLLNVLPYLRNHSRANQASFQASSKLLASLSEYHYTRKAWKKDGMELLLDPSFFQMDLQSLLHWKEIIDNLMTHDNKSIEELLTKANNISVGLFASKEQELEQRAMLIKRLSFTLFCSEKDQHQKYLQQIQEILTASIRVVDVNSTPTLHTAVFVCFRVLLVRMSDSDKDGLPWSIIINEMIHIFKTMAFEVVPDVDKSNDPRKNNSIMLKRATNSDGSWNPNSTDLACKSSPPYLALYLELCKLLDLCLALPATTIPFFQMYSWGFVSESNIPFAFDSFSETSSSSSGTNSIKLGTICVSEQDVSPRKKLLGTKALLGTSPVSSIRSKSETNLTKMEISSGTNLTNGCMIVPGKEDESHDFVPHVVRVSNLLLNRYGPVQPLEFVRGQLQLRMKSIQTLEELVPFFTSVCNDVTWQLAKNTSADSTEVDRQNLDDQIDELLARDFLENLPK